MNELELLDNILLYLLNYNDNPDVGIPWMDPEIYQQHTRQTFNAAVRKLHNDGYVYLRDTMKSFPQQFVATTYLISFEGILFIRQGGYRAQMERNRIAQNEHQRLEAQNDELRQEQQRLSRITVRLTWVVALAAVLPSVYALFQILEYFGIVSKATLNCQCF